MIHFIPIHNVLFPKEINHKSMEKVMYLTAKNLTKIDWKYVEFLNKFNLLISVTIIS